MDEKKTDRFILKIRKGDANSVSFITTSDYNYLILRSNRMLSIANIKSLEKIQLVRFDLIFKMSQEINYVSGSIKEIQIA